VKRVLRDRYGWLPLYEVRNKVLLAHTAAALRRFENSEVRHHGAKINGGQKPSALVATIILTYKRPDGLLQAVESVLNQTVRDQVIVVIDDAGGLPELPDDPRLFGVSLTHNVNVLGVERNIGMRLTDSRYIAFLDDDNFWYPNHLEVALAALEGSDGKPRPDAVYTAMNRVTPTGALHDVLSVPFDRKEAQNRCFLDSNPLVIRRSSAVMYSRLRRGKSVSPKEDWEFVYRFSRRHRVEHVPEKTVEYLVNPDSYWTPWELPATK
jgi:glycosyltransferase involved in cell wall biosynthesis